MNQNGTSLKEVVLKMKNTKVTLFLKKSKGIAVTFLGWVKVVFYNIPKEKQRNNV